MDKMNLSKKLILGGIVFFFMMTTYAGMPIWTFSSLTQTKLTISGSATKIIQYRVTNHSRKSHTLAMTPITGITQVTTGNNNCSNPFTLGAQQSCILTLQVTGSNLRGDILGGPVVCQQGSNIFCYQPNLENSLAIHLISTSPIQQYTISPSSGANGVINPNTNQTVNAGSTVIFTAVPDMGYGVRQWFLDGSLVQAGGSSYELSNITANHSVNVTFGSIILTSSVSSLALSVNCASADPSCAAIDPNLTGSARQITITNIGSAAATDIIVSDFELPSGTSVSATTCSGTLNVGSSCTITLTPGSVASNDLSSNPCTLAGTEPAAGTVSVTADGVLLSSVDIYVLGYACLYQGGYLFSVDDNYSNYPVSGSIGGTVIAQTDINVSAGDYWDSSTGCTTYPFNNCYVTNAQSGTNGTNLSTPPPGGNTYLIYQMLTTSNSLSASTYAAGLCATSSTAGYNDWYLPAICEMGYNAGSFGVNCGVSGNPTIQNIQSNLIDNYTTDFTGLTTGGNVSAPGSYWSSSEIIGLANEQAWYQLFATAGNSSQQNDAKTLRYGVRCVRKLNS